MTAVDPNPLEPISLDTTSTLSASGQASSRPIAEDRAALDALIDELAALRSEMIAREREGLARAERLHADHRRSAGNLLHYLALRRRELRPIQERLAALGLSSLGRSEPHVLANVDAVLRALFGLAGRPFVAASGAGEALRYAEGSDALARHALDLLGAPRAGRGVRILVTLPTEAADDAALLRSLLDAGMDCARINCAHDDEAVWLRMIENLRAAEAATGRSCRVLMDLAGPKLRTGPISMRAGVAKLRPVRDVYGRVLAPAVARLVPDDSPLASSSSSVPLPRALFDELAPGDLLQLEDARGSARVLHVTEVAADGARAESVRTAYLTPGLPVALHRLGAVVAAGRLGAMPDVPHEIRLSLGDTLEITRALNPGCAAGCDAEGVVREPARIGCTLPEVFDQVRAGERIWLDDGAIGGVIRAVDGRRMSVEIVQAREKGDRLGADKGINLPDSDLQLSALTDKDLRDLDFVARHADAVALSFVSRPDDVDVLAEQLRRRDATHLGIVLKIETRRAFERLPDLLLAALQGPRAGVMIARGDLAVECGWERMAEVQEEMLWICEAAHVPVIWATQVLEGLAKDGRPSRAEITDAAMGERAECVMLNKGPHLADAVRSLDDILRRMQEHQHKKRSMLRALHVAGPT